MSKLADWFDRITGRANLRAEVKQLSKQVAAASSGLDAVKVALGGKMVGYWASDHYTESKQYKGHVYCAVSTILDQIAQATVAPDELNADTHAMYNIIHNPNPDQSFSEFNEIRVLQLLLTGVCVVWNVESEGGELLERYVLPTGIIAPTRDGFRITLTAMQGVTWSEYPTRMFSILAELIPYSDCSVLRFPHPIQLGDGASPTSAIAEWIDLAEQIDNSRFNVMAKGMRPGSKITENELSDMTPEDRKRFKEELRAIASGTENAGDHLFVPKGLVLEPWALTSNELDHVNGFGQIRDAIYGAYKVPPVAAGIMEASSHAEFYAAMLQLTELRIQPLLNRLAASDRKCFAEYFDDIPEEYGYEAHRVDDPERRESRAGIMQTVGGYTPNEVRAALGDPPLAAPGMDEPMLPSRSAKLAPGQTADITAEGTGIENPAAVGTSGTAEI